MSDVNIFTSEVPLFLGKLRPYSNDGSPWKMRALATVTGPREILRRVDLRNNQSCVHSQTVLT